MHFNPYHDPFFNKILASKDYFQSSLQIFIYIYIMKLQAWSTDQRKKGKIKFSQHEFFSRLEKKLRILGYIKQCIFRL